MISLNDYQRQASITSGDIAPAEGIECMLRFFGMDTPAAKYLATELGEKQSEEEGTKPARLLVAALGLAGESGEFADGIKKIVRHGHFLSREKLIEELGDVLWYVAEAASAVGVNLSDVAAQNIAKLQKRYPSGFSEEASRNRVA